VSGRVVAERTEEVDLSTELGHHHRRHAAPAAGALEAVMRVDDLAAAREARHGEELNELDVADDGDAGHRSSLVCAVMDEGLPIAYEVLESGVPVFASDGHQVGTVAHVVAAPEEDIFHGIVLNGDQGQRFVPADQVASLHERGVDLRIDRAAAAKLPEPEGGAPAWRVEEPGVKPSPWQRFKNLMVGKDPRAGNWEEED
jgi:sporulation protein YlmC with PRC-barrel domain